MPSIHLRDAVLKHTGDFHWSQCIEHILKNIA